jgi:CubicO group peptidase (beta-lactamase class C family)
MAQLRQTTECGSGRPAPQPHCGRRLRLLIAAVAWTVAAQVPATADAQQALLRDLDGYIERALAEWQVAGLSIAIVHADSVVYARGFGVREAGRPERVTPETIFAIGSNTKLFTAVAAGMLVDDGVLGWDDRVSQHLPYFQLHDPYVTREIRIRDLLSHRSGLGRRGDLLWYGSRFSREEVLRRIRHLEPNSSFRTEFGYQNIMFLAAGEATASAAGMNWDELIVRRIFEPLGMRTSSTSVTALRGMANVATPHSLRDGVPVPVAWRNLDNAAPAGSINSSALEMAEWLRMLLGGGSHGGRTLVQPGTLRIIETPHTVMPASRDTLVAGTRFSAYGLGVTLSDYRGVKLAQHTGGIDGMLSLVAYVPERGLGLVVLTNTDGMNNLHTALMYHVLDGWLGGPRHDWSAVLLERAVAARQSSAAQAARAAAQRLPDTRPSLPLERYAGRYDHPMYDEATIALRDGVAWLRFGPLEGPLQHWHLDTFRADLGGGPFGQNALVTFRIDARGEVQGMDVQGIADFRRAQPRPGLPQ